MDNYLPRFISLCGVDGKLQYPSRCLMLRSRCYSGVDKAETSDRPARDLTRSHTSRGRSGDPTTGSGAMPTQGKWGDAWTNYLPGNYLPPLCQLQESGEGSYDSCANSGSSALLGPGVAGGRVRHLGSVEVFHGWMEVCCWTGGELQVGVFNYRSK